MAEKKKRKIKSERSRLIKKLDTLFSKQVRCRDEYTCQRCKKQYPEDNARGLDNSHYWKRGLMGTRWDFDNCIALCYGCHHKWEGDKQGEYKDFMLQRLGKKKYDTLEIKARTITKYGMGDLRIMLGLMKGDL